MRASIGWRLFLCTAIVVLVHAALAWIVGGRLASAAAGRAPSSRPPLQLVLIGSGSRSNNVTSPAAAARSVVPAPGLDATRMGVLTPTPTPKLLGPTAAEAFVSPRFLDVVARPRSAPDTTILEGLPWSGVPMRLRLFVGATGAVVDVTVLHASDEEEVVQRVRKMFLATAFIAARSNGVDVASYKDVEITVGTPVREVLQVACALPDCRTSDSGPTSGAP